MYVGGNNYVSKLNVNNYKIIEKFPLNATEGEHCSEGACSNVITVIEKFQDSLFVCGTNGQKPRCWKLRQNDPDNEKIYIFFREKNSDTNPEADPWISRVARVCKVDEGGSKRFFQNIWTSFLKARLVCGFPEESLYFNRLQDTFVMHADDWHDTRIYALFTSSWNSTAVCVYSIDTIEEVFENSTFRGYHNAVPTPRPGTCNRNSRSLPLATINLVKNHPEMSDWVHSVHYTAPFYVSNNNYVKIAVDRVQAADQCMYNVLLLSTGFGDQSLCPPGCALLPVLSHRLLPRRLHLETQRPDQSLPPDAVKLPAPHPSHDRRHVRQIHVCFSGERLHQRGEELPPYTTQP
ncbi:unnamed protein product [Tetraodon nigroviridis]|uniref:(spotted green pufferfish) hypothetical protein n=1 Tax=Tetraodon nigroviridis TaxID=99883 RepID=Q4SLZ5_TETNG|nr:unnamed protein product [Tetraodon nigroviridis]